MTNKEIMETLYFYFDEPKCELNYNSDYELLLSVMLSAQTTDKKVNKVTSILYSKYNTLEELDKLSIEEIESAIKELGFYKVKAKNFKNIVSIIKEKGYVPNDRTFLESLPGVGRKTANVVLSELFDEPNIAVDTHVARVSKRLGLVNKDDDVLLIEKKLTKYFDKKDWNDLHKLLVLFGRYRCKAIKPMCEECKFKSICMKGE